MPRHCRDLFSAGGVRNAATLSPLPRHRRGSSSQAAFPPHFSHHHHHPMKSPGSILEFTHDRNRELMSAFRKAIADRPFIDITEVSEAIVNMPCSRFWVSEERAMVVVTAMLKGKPILAAMRPTKREMFQEIYNRVLRLRASRPDAPISILVSQVVNSPAPKFYMRPRCAMEIIYKIKKGFYKKPL